MIMTSVIYQLPKSEAIQLIELTSM